MLLRLFTAVVWAAVAATVWFWGLRLWVQGEPVSAHAALAQEALAAGGDLSALLGAGGTATEAAVPVAVTDARLSLVGVVSPRGKRNANEALALISIDGKPARTYRVGAVVEGGRVLQSVSLRGATLGPLDGPAQLTLDIPLPAEALRGVPGADAGGGVPLPGLSSLPGRGATALAPPGMLTPSPRNPAPALPMAVPMQPTNPNGTDAVPGQNPATMR